MRFVPLFLLGILIQLPMLVTELSLYHHRKETRKLAKAIIHEGLEESALKAISSAQHRHDLTWLKPNEFLYKGMLYDIARIEHCPGDTVYYCWPDFAESRVKKMLDTFHSKYWQQSPARQDQQSTFWSFYQQLFFTPATQPFPCLNPCPESKRKHLEYGEDAVFPGVAELPFTPPDLPACIHTNAAFSKKKEEEQPA